LAQIEQFTTTSVRASARLDYWNQLANETYPGLFIDAPQSDLRADMLRWKLDDLTLSRPRSQASVAQRLRPSICGEPAVMLHYQRYGYSRQSQRGLTCELGPGDLALCASDEPYRLELSATHEVFVVEVPRARLESRLPDLDDRISRPLSGLTPSGRMLNAFLLSLWTEGRRATADPVWEAGVTDAFVELLALSLRNAAPQAADDPATARLLALIEDRLGDPDLGPIGLAAEMRISVRSLQKLLAARRTTPSAFIMGRRLDHAAEQLRCEPQRSITEIAFSLGFNDSAYFSRCFRRRFNLAPTAYRAGGDLRSLA
jgi:AraC-like DNA-binding protein